MQRIELWIGCISPVGKHPRWKVSENIHGLPMGYDCIRSIRVTSESGLRSGVQARPERVFWMRNWFKVQSKLTLRLYEIQLVFYSSSLLSLLYTHSIFLSFSPSLFSLSISRPHAFMYAGAVSSGTRQSKSLDKNCVLQGAMLFVMIQITIWAKGLTFFFLSWCLYFLYFSVFKKKHLFQLSWHRMKL